MKRATLLLILASLGGAALISGCETPKKGTDYSNGPITIERPTQDPVTPGTATGPSTAVVIPVGPTVEQTQLSEAVDLYNKGLYSDALKRLGTLETTASTKATQLAALKYSAFSYCLTARPALCRQQFDKAFKVDPAFDLSAGEHGHPLWGPHFAKAKRGVK